MLCSIVMLNDRDVSSVELLMKYHQGIRAEVDARNRNFVSCIDLGKMMLARKHRASDEVRTGRMFTWISNLLSLFFVDA